MDKLKITLFKNKFLLILLVLVISFFLYLKNNFQLIGKLFENFKIINNQKIKVLSNAQNIFELTENDEIFIYLKNFNRSDVNIKIYQINVNELKDEFGDFSLCNDLNLKNFNNEIIKIKLKEIQYKCDLNRNDNLIYYGEIRANNNLTITEKFITKSLKRIFEWNFFNLSHYAENNVNYFNTHEYYSFYFNNVKKKNSKKNKNIAIIFPAAEFFNYYNFENFNNYIKDKRSEKSSYFVNLNEAPIHRGLFFNDKEKLLQKNLKPLITYFKYYGYDNIDLIKNFKITKNILKKYKVIIVNYHNRYFINQRNILDNLENKLIINHSPSNFTGRLSVVRNSNNQIYGINFFSSKSKNFNPNSKGCELDKLGEIVNKDNERYIQIETFASISDDWGEEINISKINFKCKLDNNKISYPILTKSILNSNTIINFKSSSIGRNFMKFDELRSLILNEINSKISE